MSTNYSKIVFVLALFLAVVSKGNCQDASYAQLYPEECHNANAFFTQHKTLFENAAQGIGIEPQMLFAIIAPELTQYSYLNNKIETYSLKVLYVQGGKAYSDFSIGYFQMKPSFVELLEKEIATDEDLKSKYDTCLFVNPDERPARVIRVERLNTIEWQLFYLNVFCDVVQKRFDNLSFADNEEQLRFYASAYNCGFHKPVQQIKETGQKTLFPHFLRQKFRYSDIAVWFYREVVE